MTQDDSHIFCTRTQMAAELDSLLTFVLDLLRDYGLDDFYLELSTRPEGKAVGSRRGVGGGHRGAALGGGGARPRAGDRRGRAVPSTAPRSRSRPATPSGGPGRCRPSSSTSSCPQRFGLEYVGADNAKHRPIMIHRALFGSVERFFAILLEHFAGAFPTWLAPEQVRVLPVRDDHVDYGAGVVDRLAPAGLRASMEDAEEALGGRIRRAKLLKIPYVLVVGDDDLASGTVGVNVRGGDAPRARRPGGRGGLAGCSRTWPSGGCSRSTARRPAPSPRAARRPWASSSCGPAGARSTSPRPPRPSGTAATALASSAALPRAAPPRRTTGWCGAGSWPWPSSTPTPTPAATCWCSRSATSRTSPSSPRRSRPPCGRPRAPRWPPSPPPTAPTASTSGRTWAGRPGRASLLHLHLHALPRWSGDTNFMTSVAGVRVMPETLAVAWQRLAAAWG